MRLVATCKLSNEIWTFCLAIKILNRLLEILVLLYILSNLIYNLKPPVRVVLGLLRLRSNSANSVDHYCLA